MKWKTGYTFMKKYPKIKYPGDPEVEGLLEEGTRVVVQEKLDGANFRFRLASDDTIEWGTRNTVQPRDIERANKQFRHAVRYLYRNLNFSTLREIESKDAGFCNGLVFFGEAMHKHSIDYDAWEGKHPDPFEDDMPNVVIYDIWCEEHGGFVSIDELEDMCDELNLETAPVLWDGPAESLPVEKLEAVKSDYRKNDPDADSEFDREGLAEGVVIKNQGTGAVAKLVHDTFKEKNAISFNDPNKARRQGNHDGVVFVATYVTEARIAKNAHKLVDEEKYDGLCMEMMQDLPQRVLEDVMAEEGWDFLCNELELGEDEKDYVRSKTSKKCVRWLKGELQEL